MPPGDNRAPLHGPDGRSGGNARLISSLDLGQAVLLLVKASCLSHRLVTHAAAQAGRGELDLRQAAQWLADEVELEATLAQVERFPLIPAAQRARLREASSQWISSRRASRVAARGSAAAQAGEQMFEVLEALMSQYMALMNQLRDA